MALSDNKPGALGVISTIGQSVKQGTVAEIKKTVENTVEQLSGKEKKEATPNQPTPEVIAAQTAQREQDNKAMLEAMYGPSTPQEKGEGESVKGKEADLKTQLGLGEKPNTTINPLEQMGLGQNNQSTASVSEQLNFNPAPVKTPEEQQKLQQLQNQLHSEYYQKLTNPQKPAETEERQKEQQEESENAADRMARLEREDQIVEQKKKEKQKPLDVENANNIEKNRGSSG